ncbi:MAG: GNAT family N-acetyltransferase [Pseudomonadota bacterium]
MIPTIDSARLVLRPFREATDFAPVAAFFASERSAFYGGPAPRPEAWRKFAVFSGHWMVRGYGPFALEEKASGAFVGLAGPWFPEGFPEPEITWMLCDGALGKGYATEAALRALRFGYEDLGWTTAVSSIVAENGPSLRVAERLGAVHEYDFQMGDVLLGVHRHRGPTALAEVAA